ncbi:MAG: ribosome-associated translation inhibitor RaiA [Acidobacteriaceae bacterium]|nr:ribosome-associated translation inhibitor RaiA [Acidobacteriaceae bacterium]MBV9498802.1 ribosome-associated translation inhibitor RaiA [Acidobacteriaceae bacterium]
MRLIVSGKTKDFTPELEKKFSAKLAKLSKFLERRGEREAHISHRVERHLHKVQISVNFYDHVLVVEGNDSDLDTALCNAVEKLEKQIVNLRSRWRDTHRDSGSVRMTEEEWNENGSAAAAQRSSDKRSRKQPNGATGKPKIFRVNYDEGRKPMTVDEALLEFENDEHYVVFRSAERDCLSVLVRRPDGHYDLIES